MGIAVKFTLKQTLCALTAILLSAGAGAAANRATSECIAPAKPGGGFDLTCKLAQKGMQPNQAEAQKNPALRISYLPGGVGAVAWSSIVTQRRAEPETLVAFSGGSLLNIAQGKFGKATVGDVRWVAAIGTDYGMIAVRADSPYKNLRDLIDAWKRDPAKVVIGASGTIGGQDWLKVALIAKQGAVDPRSLRFVALEGGGEAFTALLADHVQVVSGDASEASLHSLEGKIRVLAVLADARLPGALAQVPTAHEQGFDVTWPIIRGLYMGPQVSDADYRKWVAAFDRMMKAPSFDQSRSALGFYPFSMTGASLTDYVRKTVDNYGKQSRELGLVR